MSQLNDATEKYCFKSVWFYSKMLVNDCKILCKVNNEVKFITSSKLVAVTIYRKSLYDQKSLF